MKAVPGCALCGSDGGVLVVRAGPLRVIRADETGFPAFYRVVWQEHVAELTDLPSGARRACMDAVCHVEEAVREHLQPRKVNLASLGNVVPHLHWHVIARFEWDSHFPGPVWAQPLRAAPADRLAGLVERLPALDQAIASRFAAAAAA